MPLIGIASSRAEHYLVSLCHLFSATLQCLLFETVVAAFAVCLGMYAMLLVKASIRDCGHTRIEKATDLTESASSCSRMRTTGRVEAFYTSCARRRSRAPTLFSARTSQTLSTRSAGIGPASKKARPRHSAVNAAITSLSPGRIGRMAPRGDGGQAGQRFLGWRRSRDDRCRP